MSDATNERHEHSPFTSADIDGWERDRDEQRRQAIGGLDVRLIGTLDLTAGGLKVHIDREVHFDRELDGSWGVHGYRVDPEAEVQRDRGLERVSATIMVQDRTVCDFLNRFVQMLANPAGEDETFGAPQPRTVPSKRALLEALGAIGMIVGKSDLVTDAT